jgi:hypothetical protein
MLLFKQELSLYIFDSFINSFFACKSINPKNYTLRGSLDLSKYYSFFLYSIQLIVLKSSIQSAIVQQDSKVILLEIQEFMLNYFNNTFLSPLSEILNNCFYCIQIN